jgi:hypothetical protein
MRTWMAGMVWVLAACPGEGPCVGVSCEEPGIRVEVINSRGLPAQPEAVRVYEDGALVAEPACTPAGTDCQTVFVSVLSAGVYRVEVDFDGCVFAFERALTEAELVPDPGLADPECCEGYDGTGVLSVVGTDLTCPDLALDVCASSAACVVAFAWPLEGEGEAACVDLHTRNDVGCRYADEICAEVETFARPPEGACVLLPNACLPADWVACEAPRPPTCEVP